MTERTTADVGAAACPFIAFDDERDERADRPDHRHRCYAEVRPAPRAIAHQTAFCLSGGFAACPTFQDWARRESARARIAAGESIDPTGVVAASAVAGSEAAAKGGAGADDSAAAPGPSDDEDEDQPARNPHRDWAAPPPWVAGGAASASGQSSGSEPTAPDFLTRSSKTSGADDAAAAAAGLAASRWLDDGTSAAARAAVPDDDELERALAEDRAARERLALDRDAAATGGRGGTAKSGGTAATGATGVDPGADDPGADASGDVPGGAAARRRAAPATTRPPAVSRRRPSEREVGGPSWEQPRRFEAYPTIRTRMGLPSVPRIALAGLAVLVAAGILFAVPFLLRSGGPGQAPAASPTPNASARPSLDLPSAAAIPTPVVYVVKQGDTMSKIAKKFGVTVDQILAANKKIKNPNRIAPGDKITIPVPLPSELDTGASPAP